MIYGGWSVDYSKKATAYKKLVNDVKNCPMLDECNKDSKIKLVKCDFCKEINLWTHWQGGEENLDAKILLVGQDWGSYNDLEVNLTPGKYMENNENPTDNNLCELFKCIGYDDIKNSRCKDLFFTNFVLCYREKGLSGGFREKWADNCKKHFLELVKIIQPKVIICLGRSVYNSVMKALGQDALTGGYNSIIEKGVNPVVVDDFYVNVFPVAHCGVLGTYNRNRPDKNVKDKLEKQKQDWEAIKKLL